MSKLRIANKHFFIALMLGVLVLTYITLKPVLSLAIMAFLIVNLFNPVFVGFKKIFRSTKVATFLSIIIVFLSVILPTFYVASTSFNQGKKFIADIERFTGQNLTLNSTVLIEDDETSSLEGVITNSSDSKSNSVGGLNVQDVLDRVNENIQKVPFLAESEITLAETKRTIAELAVPFASTVADSLLDAATSFPIVMTYLILFITLIATMFPSQGQIKGFFLKLSPLENEIDEIYIKKVLAMANSMIRGTFVIAIAQGLLSGFFLWLVGIEYVFFWTLICIFLSIIPVGAGIVTGPIAIILMLSGNIWGGITILLGNTFFVGTIDNILRPILISDDAKLNPALVLLGVIGGIQVFGILGFIFGPIVMILLSTTFDIYINYYKEDKTA